MGKKFPVVTYREVAKVARKLGFYLSRRVKEAMKFGKGIQDEFLKLKEK